MYLWRMGWYTPVLHGTSRLLSLSLYAPLCACKCAVATCVCERANYCCIVLAVADAFSISRPFYCRYKYVLECWKSDYDLSFCVLDPLQSSLCSVCCSLSLSSQRANNNNAPAREKDLPTAFEDLHLYTLYMESEELKCGKYYTHSLLMYMFAFYWKNGNFEKLRSRREKF
jgi:hypothetical protein